MQAGPQAAPSGLPILGGSGLSSLWGSLHPRHALETSTSGPSGVHEYLATKISCQHVDLKR